MSLSTSQQKRISLRQLTTGVVFKNPRPHVRSIHAYFPSVVALSDHQFLASYVLGEAFESIDHTIHLSRSLNGGETWHDEGLLCSKASERLTSEACRLCLAPNGEIVANIVRADRTDHPNEGLANVVNMGFAPTQLFITKSVDMGISWSEPTVVAPPLIGPEFEMCAPITVLRDGRWLWPTATWRDWYGRLPNGERMVAFVSSDEGKTWPTYLDVMSDAERGLIFWESKIIELADSRLLAVAWCYDQTNQCDLPNHYAFSDDGGLHWSRPTSMELSGQTLTPLLLDDGRILCVYRRMDVPGLWATLSRLEGDRWVNIGSEVLWGGEGQIGNQPYHQNMLDNFHGLKFGAPSVVRLPNGEILVVFWCYENNISVVRWFRFSIP